MRALKLITDAFTLLIVLPVTVVAVLGLVTSPLQAAARPAGPQAAFVEVSDIL